MKKKRRKQKISKTSNNWRMNELERLISSHFRNNTGNYYSINDLSIKLPIGKHEYKYIKTILNKLTKDDVIVQKGRRFTYKPVRQAEQKKIVGTFDATSLIKGYSYAFVNHPDGDIFIDSEDTDTALHNDKVLVELRYRRSGLLYGRIIKVIERANTTFTGNLIKYGRRDIFIPDLRKIHISFILNDLGKAKEGDKVIIKVTDWGNRRLGFKVSAKVVEVLGRAGEREVEELGIFRQFNLPLEFPDEVIKEVEQIDDAITDEELAKRLDLRKLTTFTIDPATAKDYDDAISLEILQNDITNPDLAYKLYVHIADVSHYVKVDGTIFSESIERGNSFYFPRRVVPMLPERLSNKICSLRPDEEKLTLTIITELDNNLKIINQSIHKSVIMSSCRLSYDEVDRFFEGDQDAVPKEISKQLSKLRIISKNLSKKRYEQGYIPFQMPDVEVVFDDDGNISNLIRAEETESHKLIENCMLLANEFVAKILKKKTKEGMYRVHEEPDEETFEKIAKLLAFYRVKVPKKGAIQKRVQGLLTAMPTDDYHRVFDYLVLRTMKKARYDTRPIGHFGLALTNYTHFTSPIRRVCDLTVHHLLKIHHWKETNIDFPSIDKELLTTAHLTTTPQHRQKTIPPPHPDEETKETPLTKIATQASERELLADGAEREIEALYKRMFMKDKVGEVYSGLIVNFSNSMITVELDELPVLGYIPISSLEDDNYRFFQDYMELIGRKSGKIIRLMDKVIVKVTSTDPELTFLME